MAFCSDPTDLLAQNCLLRCDCVCDDRVTGEGSLAIVEISEEGVYVVMAQVVAAAVVAAVLVAAVVVAAVVVAAVVMATVVVADAGVESRLVAAVVVVNEASKSIA
jgi:hypothetical protein